MRESLRTPMVKGIIGGFLGMIVALVLGLAALHVYYDHLALHQIINMVNANAAAQQARPTTPPAAPPAK